MAPEIWRRLRADHGPSGWKKNEVSCKIYNTSWSVQQAQWGTEQRGWDSRPRTNHADEVCVVSCRVQARQLVLWAKWYLLNMQLLSSSVQFYIFSARTKRKFINWALWKRLKSIATGFHLKNQLEKIQVDLKIFYLCCIFELKSLNLWALMWNLRLQKCWFIENQWLNNPSIITKFMC